MALSPEERRLRKNVRAKAYREANAERIKALKAAEYERNREHHRETRKAYYEAHREEVKARVNAHRLAHPEVAKAYWDARPEQRRAKCRRYRARHREKVRAAWDAWERANPDKARESALKHDRKYKQTHREIGRIRNAIRRGRLVSLEVRDITVMMHNQKGRCWWCGCKMQGAQYHIDHRIPVSRGGETDAANLVLSCPSCNRSKGAKMPWDFAGRLL